MRYRSIHRLMMTMGVLLLPAVATAQNSSDPEGVVRLGGIRRASCENGNCEAAGTDVSTYEMGSCFDDGCADYGCDNYWMYSDGVGTRRDQRQNRRLIRRAHVQDWLSGGAYSGSGAGCRYGDCQNGACGHGGCGHAGGCGRHVTCGVCGSGCCTDPCHAKLMHTLHWLSPYHAGCTHSPDHGWAPPGHFPNQRVAATYRNWFPNSWTGQPSSADPNFRYPMVYQPTDTTQLGYYYQRVPQWLPRAGMIPPTPHPDRFHTPDYGTHYTGVVDVGPGCHPQSEISGEYSYEDSYPVESGEYSDGSQEYPEGTITDESYPVESEPMPIIEPAPTHQPQAAEPIHSAPPAPSNAVPPAPSAVPVPTPIAPEAQPERSARAPMLYPVPKR